LLVIGVVALVVIGPERLPGAVRSCALWIGRMKRILAESRTEFEKHIGADEIRRELHNEEVMASLEKLKASRAALELDLLNYQNSLQAELNAIEHSVLDDPHTHSDIHPEDEQSGDLPQAEYDTAEKSRTPAISLEKTIKKSPAAQPAQITPEPYTGNVPSEAETQNTNATHD
jgi:sec-independent protein translocase protein TatB